MMRFHLGVNPEALDDDQWWKTWHELTWLLKEQGKSQAPVKKR
jgi:hypothetical protein